MTNHILKERTVSGLHEFLAKSLPQLNHSVSILDIGCGTGAWLERLGKMGYIKLHGIDINIEQFKSNFATSSKANLDYDDLGLGSKKFGLITAIEIIEHLENPGNLFRHVSYLLEENGYFLLTTPNIHSLNSRLKFLIKGKLPSFDEKGDQTHIYPVLLDCLYRILPRYSLEIVSRWHYPEKGSIKYRLPTQIISILLSNFLSNEISGDNLCLLIKKVNNS